MTATGGDDDKNKAPLSTAAAPPGMAAAADSEAADERDAQKWGTQVMGPPANPRTHPDNQRAAQWKAEEHQRLYYHQELHLQQPYLVFSPVERRPSSNPLEPVINLFNTWTNKAETIARDIWHNLKTGPSVSEAAWGKINLTARAITEGGFEALFKQIFFYEIQPNEKLKKTFACYLSTTTGPVAGSLYLSDVRVAFCSDRPLCFFAPSGQQTWSYYKMTVPLACLSAVNPVTMRENPAEEKYIQLVTVDDHEFWFMGFVCFEKASHHLLETVSQHRATELGVLPPPAS